VQRAFEQMGRSVAAAGLVAAVVLLGAAATRADTAARADADDSAGMLDIAEVHHRHMKRGVLVHTITTYDAWDNSALEDPRNEFYVFLQFGPQMRRFRSIVIDVASDGSLSGEIQHPTKDVLLGYVQVVRTSDRSFEVAIPKRAIARELPAYRWSAASNFHDSDVPECSDDGQGHVIECGDSAPNQGWIHHRLD
jgi:hypothetical protein